MQRKDYGRQTVADLSAMKDDEDSTLPKRLFVATVSVMDEKREFFKG